jgi:hypothetical protein
MYNLDNKGWKTYNRCPKELNLEQALLWQSRLEKVYENLNQNIKTKLMEKQQSIGGN